MLRRKLNMPYLKSIPSDLFFENFLMIMCTTPVLFTLMCTNQVSAATLGEFSSQSELQSNTGNGISTVCDRFEGGENARTGDEEELFSACDGLVSRGNVLSDEGNIQGEEILNGNLQNVAVEEIAAPSTIATKTAGSQITAVMARISALQKGSTGFGMSINGVDQGVVSRNTNQDDIATLMRGGSAGADPVNGVWGRWGGFVNLTGSTGDKDATGRENGFDFDTFGLTAGIDYRLSANFVIGSSLTYNRLESDFVTSIDVSGGGLEADTYSLSLYSLYTKEALYINGMVGYARNEYDIERRIVIPGFDRTAKGDTSADVFLLSAGGGYDFGKKALQFGPVLNFNYLYSDLDGYEETGAGGLNMAVESYNIDSLTSSLGAQISYTSNQSFGVLIPYVSAEWRHEFLDDSTSISTRYVNEFVAAGASPTIFTVNTDGADEDYGVINAGVSTVLQNGMQAVISYQKLVALSDIDQDLFTIGLRFEF